MNYFRLLALFFSFLGTICLCISTFSKNKSKMMIIQALNTIFNSISNFFVGSYSGMVMSIISSIRNILIAKDKMNKILIYIFSSLMLIIGLYINKKGIIGLFPVMASIEYTIWSSKSKNSQSIRYGIIINLLLWSIHDIYLLIYPAIIGDVILIVITTVNIIRYKKQ